MVKVLNCPCCESKNLYVGVTSFSTFGVQCNSCGLKVERELPYDNPERTNIDILEIETQLAAIKAWNRRPEEIRLENHFCTCNPKDREGYLNLHCEICEEDHICGFCEKPIIYKRS